MSALSQLSPQGLIPRTIVLDREHRIVLRELGYTGKKFQNVVQAVRAVLNGTEFRLPPAETVAAPQVRRGRETYTVSRIETVASAGNVGFFTSVSLDAQGNPVVACKDYGRGALLLTTWAAGAWRHDYVDHDSAGWSPSVAFDHEGRPGVSYGCGNSDFQIRYAHFDGQAWKVEVVDDQGNPFKATSLAYTTGGDPLISFSP